jgi:hypothetical protein
MANVTVSISSAKLNYAIAYIEGLKQGNSKVTDAGIDKALTDLGYTLIEIYIIKSTSPASVIDIVFNPPLHHLSKERRNSKKKSKKDVPQIEVATTFEDNDEDNDEDNVLGA